MRVLLKKNKTLTCFCNFVSNCPPYLCCTILNLPQSGFCEVITEEASAALRKANKWAQSGLIVSVVPPVETVAQESAGGVTTGDKKKTAQTAVCRDRNAELAR